MDANEIVKVSYTREGETDRRKANFAFSDDQWVFLLRFLFTLKSKEETFNRANYVVWLFKILSRTSDSRNHVRLLLLVKGKADWNAAFAVSWTHLCVITLLWSCYQFKLGWATRAIKSFSCRIIQKRNALKLNRLRLGWAIRVSSWLI